MTLTINCDTGPKQQNRVLIREWIERKFTPKRLKNAKVLCLPGWQGKEIYEIWDKLGVKRKNIYAVTNEQDDYEKIKKIKNINAYCLDINNTTDMFKAFCPSYFNTNLESLNKDMLKVFDIIYLDTYGNYSINMSGLLHVMHLLKNKGLFGYTWFGSREQGGYRDVIMDQAASIDRDHTRFGLFIGKSAVRLTWDNIYVHALRKANGYEMFRAKNKTQRHNGSLRELFEFMRADCFIKEQVHKYGMYLKQDVLKTKYVTPVGTPMMTFFAKAFNCNRLDKETYINTIWDNIDLMQSQEITFIKKNKPNTTKKQKVVLIDKSLNNMIRRSSKKDIKGKDEIIKLIKDGFDVKDIAVYCNVKDSTVRAYKAHVTMGTYN